MTHALERGLIRPPGKTFKYSSGNSHFLTSLVYYKTNTKPGILAKERLFDPMGIEFQPLTETIVYNNWNEYKEPLYQSWRQDTKGIECASFSLYLKARDMAKFGYLYLNRGRWDKEQLISEDWVISSTKDHKTNIYGRYSYGYQWYLTMVGGHPSFLASGFGGQIIGVVPSLCHGVHFCRGRSLTMKVMSDFKEFLFKHGWCENTMSKTPKECALGCAKLQTDDPNVCAWVCSWAGLVCQLSAFH